MKLRMRVFPDEAPFRASRAYLGNRRNTSRQFAANTELDGGEKWTASKFTKNVYDIWMPTHFERICSVVDQLPSDLDFELSQQSELQFPEES